FTANATNRLGKVAEGNTVCDFDTEETKRKVSVSSAIAPFEWKDAKINLIDTPGLFDFEAGLYEGIRAAESVVITVSGKSGCAVGTEKAFKLAKAQKKAIMFFVSKLDNENADFDKAVASLKDTFGATACPIIVPYKENNVVKSYVNLIDMKAYTYNEKGVATEVEMPTIAGLDDYINSLNEAIAETDEALMDKYFSGEQFTKEEFMTGLSKGVSTGSVLPIVCGSTITMAGVTLLQDAIVKILPSPVENGKELAKNSADKVVEIPCNEDDPLAAYVFKTVADPFVGKLSYIKVVSGKLSASSAPINARTGQPEKLGKLLIVQGKKQEDTEYIGAGDIGCVTKLSEAVTGDSLCDAKRVVSFNVSKFPKACLQMAIKPKVKGEENKIVQGIQRLMEEDPTVSLENNYETKQMLVGGMGEQHIDVIVSRLKAKFGVDSVLEKPRVAYRETVRKTVKVQGRHKKQSGGHGQFGDIWVEFGPCDSEGLLFEEKVFGGAVPRNFFPAVEKGLQDCIKKGPLAGYPVVGLRATLVDGSYHPVDS
ncbi:MAG: elongation factor G, partial [Oscillospiraceae bacterium]